MKKITAIVRPEKLEAVKEALFEANIQGMTISQVQGCGKQHGWTEYYRGTQVVLNMLPKIQFEIVVNEQACGNIVDLIVEVAHTGQVGDGKIFISNIEDVIRIRTRESGEDAL